MPHYRLFLRVLNAAKFNLSACFLLLIISTNTIADITETSDTKTIVVTIKPLYSLVAHLTEGIEKPVLLFKNIQSPHHYNMRPSERRLLAKADIIVWLGSTTEPQIDKIIQQQEQTTSISVMQAKNLKLLNKRSKHSHDEIHPTEIKSTNFNMVDSHVWLSAHNAAQISKHIAKHLTTYDSKNAEQYRANLTRLLDKIEHTKNSIKNILDKNDQPYLSFHDAFQYFEDEYGLNYIGSINYGDEAGTSLKHIQQIERHIREKNIKCLVYQPPRPALIDSLSQQTNIKSSVLDPLGINASNDKNAWFDIMHQISTNFSTCLNP